MDAQSLQVFQQFVEFVKNIDNYESLLVQIKAATDAYNQAFNQLTEGQTVAQFKKKLDVLQTNLDFERSEFQKTCQNQQDSLDQRAKELDDREEKLVKLIQDQTILTKEANDFMAVVTQKQVEVDKMKNDLNAQIDANNKLAADLASKQAVLAQVFK